jgi:hypothetical protein
MAILSSLGESHFLQLRNKYMEFNLLRAGDEKDRKQWLVAIEQLPNQRQDVYFYPEYLQAYDHLVDAEACCAVYRKDNAILIYPFLKSTIDITDDPANTLVSQDIQTPYGYGGPVVNELGEAPDFLYEVWSHFSDWCLSEGVVSEFVRFHPLLDNVRWAPMTMNTFLDRLTIPIPLGRYSEELYGTSYYARHRQMLNKAERVGFTFEVLPAENELSWFFPLYEETQDFLQAADDVRFGEHYFKSLIEGFGSRAWLGVVKLSGEIAAAALVLEGKLFLHSHLMGYKRDIQTSGMTNLLYHGIALDGAKRGKTILHMGGGLSSDEKDHLFRFKKSLSPERANFSLGTLCHNQLQYEKLGQHWEVKYGPRPKNYFQFYRLTE